MRVTATCALGVSLLLGFQASVFAQQQDPGKMEFSSSCGACHGADGKGNGIVASELKVSPPDLTQLAKKNGGVFPIGSVYEQIDGRQQTKAHGSREMPVWGYRYMPMPTSPGRAFNWSATSLAYDPELVVRDRILALVEYLYRIQEK